MKARKTLIGYIDELGNMGFLNYAEHTKIKKRIHTRYNGNGWK